MGDTSIQEAARQHGLTVAEIEQWKARFLAGAENALRSRPLDEEEMKHPEIKRLKQMFRIFNYPPARPRLGDEGAGAWESTPINEGSRLRGQHVLTRRGE